MLSLTQKIEYANKKYAVFFFLLLLWFIWNITQELATLSMEQSMNIPF